MDFVYFSPSIRAVSITPHTLLALSASFTYYQYYYRYVKLSLCLFVYCVTRISAAATDLVLYYIVFSVFLRYPILSITLSPVLSRVLRHISLG